MQVQSMETAPRDGTVIWLYDGETWRVGAWCSDKSWPWCVFEPDQEAVDGWRDQDVSLWAPIQAPPA